MKSLIAAAALIVLGATAAQAGPPDVSGLWLTAKGATVEIARCGGSLCGKLVSSAAIRSNPAATDGINRNEALRGRRLKGLVVIWGLKANATGWSGGHMYNPEDGKTYLGSIDPGPGGMLKVKGCISSILGVNFCGVTQWKRAK